MFEAKSIPIEQIKPYPQNAKRHPDRQIELLAKQIAYGFDQPIVVDKNLVIIKGHGRLLASQKLGLKSVPVIVRDDLTESQVKAARIADNKLAETDWDMDLLAQELESLQDDFILDDLGFNQEELERLLDGFVGGDGSFGGDEIVEDDNLEPNLCPSCGAVLNQDK
jgi:ParB-like chromosome segregation protein Spo0J